MILLIYNYDKTVGTVEKIGIFIFSVVYGTFLLTDVMVPEYVWPIVTSSNFLFNMGARLPQIYGNWVNKSTGVLSFVTFLLSWLGSLARTATVLMESDDPFYNFQFILSATFNTIIIA